MNRSAMYYRLKRLSEEIKKIENMGAYNLKLDKMLTPQSPEKVRKMKKFGLANIIALIVGLLIVAVIVEISDLTLIVVLKYGLYPSINRIWDHAYVFRNLSVVIVFLFSYSIIEIPSFFVIKAVREGSEQKKIRDFLKFSDMQEKNLNQALRIFNNIKGDIQLFFPYIPTEFQNSTSIMRLAEIFTLYDVKNITEAVEVYKKELNM